jgi:hypothetical protein
MEFNVIMIRTYETTLVYEADSFEEAVEIAKKDEFRYSVELDQCCVTFEGYEQG